MGILERLKLDIIRPSNIKPYPRVWRDEPLSISQLGIVFIILTVGHFLTLMVFFCELLRRRSKKTLDQKCRDSSNKPREGEDMQLHEIARLTMLYYGRSLEEYL